MLEKGTSIQIQYEDILLSSGDLCLKAQFFGVTMDCIQNRMNLKEKNELMDH